MSVSVDTSTQKASPALVPARREQLEAVAAFVNGAYRGEGARLGWTHEADLLDGQRTSAQSLERDLAARPGAAILTRRGGEGELLGSVWLEPAGDAVWYLGMLTIRPDLQGQGLGRALIAGAEAWAHERGARRMRMTVIGLRESLIAWYGRRGYRPTGETAPFPYGDPEFGLPRRDDLAFVVLEKTL